MEKAKFSKETVRDDISVQQTFAVSGKRFEKQCQPCSTADMKTKAEYWCVDCSEYLCSPCSKTHTRFAYSRDHKIVAVSQADVNISFSFDMKGLDQCIEHGKQIEFLCENDDTLCCSTCVIAKHRTCHNMVEIENKAKTNKTDLTSVRRDLLDIESKVKAYGQRLKNIRANVATDASIISGKIQEMHDKVNEMFENLKWNVAQEIDSFQQHLDKKNDVCMSNTNEVKEALSDVTNIRQQGTPTQQLIMAHHLKAQAMVLKMKIDNDNSDLKYVNMSFDFNQSIQLPPTDNTTPGKLTMCYARADVTTFPARMKNQHKDQKVKLIRMTSIGLKQGDSGVNEPFISGLNFLPDGRLIAVDHNNRKCLVYNQKLEILSSAFLPDNLYHVTVMNDDKVAVTGGDKIYFIKIGKSGNVNLTRTLKVNVICNSICMMTDEDFLVGCCCDPKPVRVVSVRGEVRAFDITFPSKQYESNESACTYIKNRNKVVLSDRYAHTVYIYNIANNSKVEVKDEKIIKKPLDVAIGPADCIFVCSKDTHSIVQISHTGQIISSHVLDMEFPLSVCVSNDNTRLAVSNAARGNKKLQLFNIELI